MTSNDNNMLLIETIQQKSNNNNSPTNDDIPNYDFKTVCIKERVFLKREKSCNIFLLQFNLENRNKTCYLIKKGRLIHENINYIHPPNSICIDDLSLKEKFEIFNQCQYFYTYDLNTAYVIFAAACGCIPIILCFLIGHFCLSHSHSSAPRFHSYMNPITSKLRKIIIAEKPNQLIWRRTRAHGKKNAVSKSKRMNKIATR